MKKVFLVAAVILTIGLFFYDSLLAAEIEEDGSDGALNWLREHVTIGGTLEIEAWWTEDFEGVSDNGVDLATSELEIEAEVTGWAVGNVVIEWDTDEDQFRIDEATAILGPTEDFPVYSQFGFFEVPFGVYDGNTVTDPLTEEVFKIKEVAVMAGMDEAGFYTSVYFFNGDANEGNGNNIFNQFGANFGYRSKAESYKLSWNIGFVNSLTSSETLSEEYDMDAGYVGGLTAQLGLRVAGCVFLAEYVGAFENYQPLDEEEESAKPNSYHLEAGYNLELFEFPLLLSVAYSQSSDLVDIVPRSRLSTVLWIGLMDEVNLNFEYTQDRDYGRSSGGSGRTADLYTIQVSYEF